MCYNTDMFTAQFWKDALERSISTFAETFLALVTIVGITDWVDVDWFNVFITALISAGFAILKSIVAKPVGTRGTASVIKYQYQDDGSGREAIDPLGEAE